MPFTLPEIENHRLSLALMPPDAKRTQPGQSVRGIYRTCKRDGGPSLVPTPELIAAGLA
jgi:hypothetical protein